MIRLGTIIIVALVLWHGAASAQTAGAVLALRGDAAREAGGTHQPLKVQDAVAVGDTLAVGAGGKLKVRLVDGSVLSLAENTRLTIDAAMVQGDRRDVGMTLADGLLRAVVSKMGPDSRFEVGSATAVAAARSTDWFVEVTADRMRVGVLEGVVALAGRASAKSVEVKRREGARVDGAAEPTAPKLWSKAEFDEYRRRTALQ